MCYDHMIAIVEGETDSGAPPVSGTTKTKKNTKMGSDPNYQAIIKELELQKRRPNGFVAHPKMEKLKMLVIQHFASKTADPDIETGEGAALVNNITEDTRVMVFVTYRNCVEEIVAFLNQEQPLIKATKFIGQATDKDGNRGFGQREQLDVRHSLCMNKLCVIAVVLFR
jgi:ATP-dependent DNA helicase MPH1